MVEFSRSTYMFRIDVLICEIPQTGKKRTLVFVVVVVFINTKLLWD